MAYIRLPKRDPDFKRRMKDRNQREHGRPPPETAVQERSIPAPSSTVSTTLPDSGVLPRGRLQPRTGHIELRLDEPISDHLNSDSEELYSSPLVDSRLLQKEYPSMAM
jgi:hypothetical protein